MNLIVPTINACSPTDGACYILGKYLIRLLLEIGKMRLMERDAPGVVGQTLALLNNIQ